MEQNLILRYTLHEDGAHLVQALGESPCLELPDTLGGRPVTQIGAYAFAQNPAKIRPEGPLLTETLGSPAGAEPLCGRALVSVRLPGPVRILQSACFFDCRGLTELSAGPEIRALGSDLFTNCSKLSLLKIRSRPDRPTGLQKLLYALQNDLRVEFEEEGRVLAALHYPEFWEELEENAPAHIFNMGIHGQGYQYRQCFSQDVLNFAEYDRSFHPALAEGSHALLGLLALDRLRFPWDLKEEARAEYRDFLAREGDLAGKALISADQSEALDFLCGLRLLDEAAFGRLTAFAAEADKPAALALLMDHKHKTFGRAKKNYSFDF
ncbi:leucine-rich repeat protein [Fournierella massiliensis]|nr:leucine-rich repeat protein [Fournierella massiliensis]MCF2558113.1 leucine-rich repeat protein [Fournierella massiliensis]